MLSYNKWHFSQCQYICNKDKFVLLLTKCNLVNRATKLKMSRCDFWYNTNRLTFFHVIVKYKIITLSSISCDVMQVFTDRQNSLRLLNFALSVKVCMSKQTLCHLYSLITTPLLFWKIYWSLNLLRWPCTLNKMERLSGEDLNLEDCNGTQFEMSDWGFALLITSMSTSPYNSETLSGHSSSVQVFIVPLLRSWFKIFSTAVPRYL